MAKRGNTLSLLSSRRKKGAPKTKKRLEAKRLMLEKKAARRKFR